MPFHSIGGAAHQLTVFNDSAKFMHILLGDRQCKDFIQLLEQQENMDNFFMDFVGKHQREIEQGAIYYYNTVTDDNPNKRIIMELLQRIRYRSAGSTEAGHMNEEFAALIGNHFKNVQVGQLGPQVGQRVDPSNFKGVDPRVALLGMSQEQQRMATAGNSTSPLVQYHHNAVFLGEVISY
jgi:hypothetical protein